MKLSRNALGNLANRYRAVLRKCRLLNTFGILLLAGCCVVGRGGAVSAEPLYGQKETSQNASVTGGDSLHRPGSFRGLWRLFVLL